MRGPKSFVLLTASALTIGGLAAQTPNLSGTWSFVSAPGVTASGGGERGREAQTTAQWVNLAGVNCGPECTIAQNAKTLTITRPGNEPGAPDTGLVVLNLDGSDSTITQSNGSKFVVQAKWDGGKLVVTHKYAYFTITQVLFLEDGRLKIVNDLGVGGPPVTATYVKRQN